MAGRRQTPDVLGDVLGDVPQVPQARAAPEPKPATKRRPAPRRSSPSSRSQNPRWEYREIVFRDYGGYRPRLVDGIEQRGWKDAPFMHPYLNQLGEEGWELASLSPHHKNEMLAYLKRPKG
jgi:hypothetical protein